jgi:mono/diheme cytochrome c family protein
MPDLEGGLPAGLTDGRIAIVSGVIRPAAALAVVALTAAASGCGGTGIAPSSQVDMANGKKLFQAKCGGCHTLADAGSSGTIGPNLDDAYVGDRVTGMQQSSFEALVRQQIEEADAPMPRDLVTGADAEDVAAYVASVAGLKLAQQERQQNGLTTTPQ